MERKLNWPVPNSLIGRGLLKTFESTCIQIHYFLNHLYISFIHCSPLPLYTIYVGILSYITTDGYQIHKFILIKYGVCNLGPYSNFARWSNNVLYSISFPFITRPRLRSGITCSCAKQMVFRHCYLLRRIRINVLKCLHGDIDPQSS